MNTLTVRNTHSGHTFTEQVAQEDLAARLAWHAGRTATVVVQVDGRDVHESGAPVLTANQVHVVAHPPTFR
jgi:hypothetical protein